MPRPDSNDSSYQSEIHFELMRKTRACIEEPDLNPDIQTLHPKKTHRIGASLLTGDRKHVITTPNVWIRDFVEEFENINDALNFKIGDASPTVHAEVALLIEAINEGFPTEGAQVYLTDPPCPNCVKILVAAGIMDIYVDAKGLEKDWYSRRKDDFEKSSIPWAAENGVQIHKVTISDELGGIGEIAPLHEVNRGLYNQYLKGNIFFPDGSSDQHYFGMSHEIPNVLKAPHNNTDYLLAHVIDDDDNRFVLIAPERSFSDTGSQKYKPTLHPINHFIAICARFGAQLTGEDIVLSYAPTAREMVNFYDLSCYFEDLGLCSKSPPTADDGTSSAAQIDAWEFFKHMGLVHVYEYMPEIMHPFVDGISPDNPDDTSLG